LLRQCLRGEDGGRCGTAGLLRGVLREHPFMLALEALVLGNPDTMPCDLDGSTPGLGGWLYRWPIDAATNRLRTSGGYISAEKAYFMTSATSRG
jgi:hypothetical protein